MVRLALFFDLASGGLQMTWLRLTTESCVRAGHRSESHSTLNSTQRYSPENETYYLFVPGVLHSSDSSFFSCRCFLRARPALVASIGPGQWAEGNDVFFTALKTIKAGLCRTLSTVA